MLLLKGQKERWERHEKSGAEFLIRPVTTAETQAISKAARDADGNIDAMKYGKGMMRAAIADWKGVGGPDGPLPVTPENVDLLVENVGDHMVAWITKKATALDRFISGEIEQAKNA